MKPIDKIHKLCEELSNTADKNGNYYSFEFGEGHTFRSEGGNPSIPTSLIEQHLMLFIRAKNKKDYTFCVREKHIIMWVMKEPYLQLFYQKLKELFLNLSYTDIYEIIKKNNSQSTNPDDVLHTILYDPNTLEMKKINK